MEVALGPPTEARSDTQFPGPRHLAAREFAMDVETPIEPGLQTTTASVTIRYRILEEGW